jgi:ribosome biogenesis GTPase
VSVSAKIIKVVRSTYTLSLPDQSTGLAILPGRNKRLEKTTRGIVCVGDNVLVSKNADRWVIEEVLPRSNVIARKSPGKDPGERIIAANIDCMVIVASFVQPDFNGRLIDRYLLAAARFSIAPLLIISKHDLIDYDEEIADLIRQRFRGLHLPILPVSLMHASHKEELTTYFRNRVLAIVGASGVGKTSLLNLLGQNSVKPTNSVSQQSGKGRHTTTHVEMHQLNELDSWIVDTPGIREFGIVGLQRHEIPGYFADFQEYSQLCRFSNCMHMREPACGVKQAVSDERLDIDRYQGYLNIIASVGKTV